MRYSKAILFALPPALLAAKLQDFQPRINSLGPQCNAAYNQEVSSCSKTDFDPNGSGCSADCLEGLQTLVPTVRTACASEDFGDGPNLVKLFIQGTGPQILCKNYNSLVASISEPATQPAISSATPSSNSDIGNEATSTQAVGTSSSEASATDSKTTSASSSHSTQASTSCDPLTDSSSTASSTTSSTTSTSTRKSDSGGGSPFDSPANSEACGMRVSIPTATGIFLLLVFAAMAR